MKDKILKEKKLKNKFLAVSMASLILMSSFPVTSPVYALANEALDGVTQATENDSNILKELTKDADATTIVIKDGSFTYKLKVFVNKHANFVEGIVDETDPVNGVYGSVAMIWGQFKGENKGLKKYGGKTFGEIKAMPTPEDIIVMGGQRDDIPNKVHKKILEFIAKEEAKAGKEEKEKKNELAKNLYKYRYRYVYKNTQIWDATTLSQFLDSYDKARKVLEKSNPSDSEISEKISDLETKYKAIKAAPFSDAKFKELVRQSEEKINNKEHYTLSTMAELQRVLAEVRNDFDAGKIKNLLEMNKAEEKLQKALDQLVTKEESKKRFTIDGEIFQYGNENEKSMANQFMDKNILLIEEANSNIYEIKFKKGSYLGISAEVEGLKYDRGNGNWQRASLVNTVNDIKTFRLVMPKSDIKKIHIKTLAHMGGPDLAEQDAVLKLSSTKRSEGSQLEEGNKKKLKEFLDSIQELNTDINAGLYKEPNSTNFKNKYIEATKLLESTQATDEAIDEIIRSIRIIKQDLILKAVDDFGQKLGKAEGITTDQSSKDKYTEKSLAKLKEAVDAGNAVWGSRYNLKKEELARLINLLDTAMTDLREKGQEEEEEHSTEEKPFTAPVELRQASNPTQKSMANGAIVSPAKLIYNGDKVTIELEFKGLDLKGMKGHLTNLFYFENNQDPKSGGQAVETKIEKKFMDTGLDGKEKEFPQVFSFTIDRNLFEESEFLWCRVWVDVMDGFMGGPGKGAQEARIVIDKTNLPKEEPLNKDELTNLINEAKSIEQGDKTEEAFKKLQGVIKKAEESIDNINSKKDLENAKNELQKAIKEFKDSPAEVKEAKNKPELEKLLHEQDSLYQDVLKGEYKEEGSKLYLDKYKEAIKLVEDPKAKEEDIDNVIRSLKSIKQNSLILKILDVFQDLIVKAEEITNEGNSDKKYTDDSFNKLKEAVAEANKYWKNRFDQPKDKIETLNKMLKESLAGLKEVEKTELKKEALKIEIENAKNIEQGKKTDEAFKTLKAAITSAEEALNSSTKQTQLDEAVKTLKAAVVTFKESADKVEPQAPLQKEELTKEIAAAKKVEQGKKTDEAFNTLKAAITSAEDALNSSTKQTQLDEAVRTLKAAVKAFKDSADKVEPQPQPEPSPQEKPEVDPGKKPDIKPEVSPEKETNSKPEAYFPNFSSHRRNSSSSRTNEGKVYVGSPKATKDLVRKEEVKKAEVKAPEGKESQSNTIPNNFEDTKGHWANKAIDYVVNKGYFSGISEKEFGPNKAITRGQFVTVLGRILNINVDDFKSNKFKDVDSSQYYAAYVSWAESVGITKGRGNGNFDPNKEITREEMAVMMEKFLNVSGKNLGEVENTKKFKDEGKIQSWAQESVKKMTRLGLINGMEDGSFSPKSSFTRGQVAQILYNMDNK